MDLNLTVEELRMVIMKAGYDVPRDIEWVIVGHKVHVKILHQKYSHVVVARLSPKRFSVNPYTGWEW